MTRLIDIAGRTGQPPVRALFGLAVGSNDDAILQPHEIRYRNDQHHVLYGLYDDDALLGVIGLARVPADDAVEIHHIAVAGGEGGSEHTRQLIELAVSRQRQPVVRWQVPESFVPVAEGLGFRLSDRRQYREVWVVQCER